MKWLFALLIAWTIAVYAYEFKILKRPALAAALTASERPAPEFGLANLTFACAAQKGFVTGLRLSGGEGGTPVGVQVVCESGFTDQTTRCPSLLPMAGFGEQIKCQQAEAIHCHGGPLQTLGLFKDDSFCGDVSDRDMGPPEEAPRTED
jgi:hypothetical protein